MKTGIARGIRQSRFANLPVGSPPWGRVTAIGSELAAARGGDGVDRCGQSDTAAACSVRNCPCLAALAPLPSPHCPRPTASAPLRSATFPPPVRTGASVHRFVSVVDLPVAVRLQLVLVKRRRRRRHRRRRRTLPRRQQNRLCLPDRRRRRPPLPGSASTPSSSKPASRAVGSSALRSQPGTAVLSRRRRHALLEPLLDTARSRRCNATRTGIGL